MTEREQQLEATLRDIIVGCDMMLPYATRESERRFIGEIRRVASAPLGDVRNIVTEVRLSASGAA